MDIYVIAQIIGAVAMTGCVLQMQLKNSRHMLFSQIPLSSLWALQYFLLSAPAGMASNIVNIMRGTSAMASGRTMWSCFWGLNIAVVALCGYVYSGPLDLLPAIAGLLSNTTLPKADNRPYVCRAIIAQCALWMVYNFAVESWMGLGCAALVIVSTLISMVKYEGWTLFKAPMIAQAAE